MALGFDNIVRVALCGLMEKSEGAVAVGESDMRTGFCKGRGDSLTTAALCLVGHVRVRRSPRREALIRGPYCLDTLYVKRDGEGR